jgi:hypothetical protein
MAGRVRELRARLATLVRSYHELAGPMARQLVAEDIGRTEGELAVLEGDDLDIRGQVREAVRELIAGERAVSRARAERRADRKGELVRRVVERVVCWFDYYEAGTQSRSRLARVEILPLVGEAMAVPVDQPCAMEGAPRRAS